MERGSELHALGLWDDRRAWHRDTDTASWEGGGKSHFFPRPSHYTAH